MPTVFIIFGLRFFFYKNDHEPIHVHVENQGNVAKIQIEPEIKLIWNHGLKNQMISKALKTTEIYKEEIIAEWNKNFPKK